MKAVRFFIAIATSSALRVLSLAPMVRTTGNMNGTTSATSLCVANAQNYPSPNTTWVPLLETSPPSFKQFLEGFSSIYPYTDARNPVTTIWNSNLFAPAATLDVLQGENATTPKFTGWDGATCQGWTNTTGVGGSGINVASDQFLVAGTVSCSSFNHIVCLEVPRTKFLAPPIRFFITAQTYNGNLGGLRGADAKCNAQAAQSTSAIKDSGGRWYALLHTQNISISTRMASVVSSQAIFLPSNSSPGTTTFHLVSGQHARFADTKLYSYDSEGKLVNSVIWTGSDYGSNTCNDWTTTASIRGWYASALGGNPLLLGSTVGCESFLPIYCLQYLSPFVSESIVVVPSESSAIITATMYADVTWTVLRCVATPSGYITNVTDFWTVQTSQKDGYSVSEAQSGSSSSATVTLRGLLAGITSYVTCSARATSYIDLTWLKNVSAVAMPAPPILQDRPTKFTTRIELLVRTNQTSAMRVRCLAAVNDIPASAFWGNFSSSVLVIDQTTLSNTPEVDVLFNFSGLGSYTQYTFQCAQFKVGETSSSSTSIAALTETTLPMCINTAKTECNARSRCVDSTDMTMFRCSPYIFGGFKSGADLRIDPGNCSDQGTRLTLNTTEGNESITFCVNIGKNVPVDDIPTMSFYYGTASSPRRFRCLNPEFSSIINNAVGVTCVPERGIGGNLNFALLYQTNVLAVSDDVLSYPAPLIKHATLRLAEFINSTGSSQLTLEVAQADVAFDVEHVQLMPELRVVYGLKRDSCRLDRRTTASTIVCSTSPETEFTPEGFTFTVDANGQTAVGSDILKLPAGRPTITNITSTKCSQAGAGLAGCPTQGNSFDNEVMITITGTNFGTDSSQLRVMIDGAGLCEIKKRIVPLNGTHIVECLLPSGTGLLRNVYIQNELVVSASRPLISYAPPVIKTVCGCANPCAPTPSSFNYFAPPDKVTDCERNGGDLITILGENFGAAGATVLVGSSSCRDLIHDLAEPHERLMCELPSGYQKERSLLVAQGNGAVSETSTATVGYRQCGAGTMQFEDEIDCQNCAEGYFSAVSGLSACLPCSPGTFAAKRSATACEGCATGKYQANPGQNECLSCPQGNFTASQFSTDCPPCAPGTFNNVTNSSACESCEAGASQPQPGQTGCLLCEPGSYQNNMGRPECIACSSGKITNVPGMPECVSCGTGQYQAKTKQSSCDWCLAGSFIDVTGAAECIHCEYGKYSDRTGVSACSDCPAGSSQAGDGATRCDNCTVGRFTNLPHQRYCEACEMGSVTFEAGVSSCFVCPPHSTAGDGACPCNPGYAWSNLTCAECAVGQDCRMVGTLRSRSMALPGFVRTGQDPASVSFQACLVSTYCPGGQTRCAPFREGFLCHSCQSGYREDSGNLDGGCSPCASQATSTANIAAAIVVCILVLVFLYYIVVRTGMEALTPKTLEKTHWWDTIEYAPDEVVRVPAVKSDDGPIETEEGPVKPPERLRRKISVHVAATREHRVPVSMAYQRKIIITFIQLATTSLTLSTLSMPPSFRVVLDGFDFVNLNVIPWGQVGCLTPFSLLTKIVATAVAPVVILPIAAFLLVLALKIVDRCRAAPNVGVSHNLQLASSLQRAKEKYRAVFMKVSLFTVFLVYPAVSRQIFAYFRCVRVLREGLPDIYLLKESFREECYNTEWNSGLAPVVVLICIYPLGVPAILGFILKHFRPRFHEPYISYTLGFAFEGFLPQFWYFELVDITHKFFISCIVTLLPDSAQVPVDMAILGSYLCVLHFAQPYVRRADNQFHMLTQTEIYLLVFSFLAREYTGPIPLGSEEDLLLSTLLLFLFLGILVLFVVRVIRYAGCGARLCMRSSM